VEFVSLPDGLDWIMRPWARGKAVLYESLKDGTLDLMDIALMNDAIDVADENERRAIAARRTG
jgi:uncharacterized protein DUF6889